MVKIGKNVIAEAISVTEASKILGCSRRHVFNLIDNHALWKVLRVGKQYILDANEVREFSKSWIKQHD